MLDESDKKIIKEMLVHKAPVLFLGAGFTRECRKGDGTKLPTGSVLRQRLFDAFIKNKMGKVEQEISDYDLRDTCGVIAENLGKKQELYNFIKDQFDGAKPTKYHQYLTKYPWKKIYTVNVDCIVEYIYKKQKKPCVVQKTKHKKPVKTGAMEIVKLHGSVDNLNEPMIFSRDDYTNLMQGELKYKLMDLMCDIQNDDFIFVGASLDEPDIDFYLSKYENAGYELARGKIVCIDPEPSYKVQSRMDNLGGRVIKATDKEFLEYINELDYDPDEHEMCRRRLEISGIHQFKSIMETMKPGVYESHLYQGYESNWKDLRDEWIFPSPDLLKLQQLIENIEYSQGGLFCLALYGKSFAGKGCILKSLSLYLDKNGYDVLIYNGKEFDTESLIDYIVQGSNERYALIINKASYYYRNIESLYEEKLGKKKLLVITASREYQHERKKYYLEGNEYEQYEIRGDISKAYAGMIHSTLVKKGGQGYISQNKDIGIPEIIREKTLINLFSKITFGEGFMERLDEDVKGITGIDEIKELYIELAICDKADIEYLPKEIINGRCRLAFTQNGTGAHDYRSRYVVDHISYSPNGLSIKNSLLTTMILKSVSTNYKKKQIIDMLSRISEYVQESAHDYWKMLFENISKYDWLLQDDLGFSKEDVLEILYSIKEHYQNISYYWLQLGIAEQGRKDFSKAKVHLATALRIRPNAYQIQHAVARNYLKWANAMGNDPQSKVLFDEGKRLMLELINSTEYYKKKARNYAIHCYLNETIRYMDITKIKPTRREVNDWMNMLEYVEVKDDYYASLAPKVLDFLKKTDTIEYATISIDSSLIGKLGETMDRDVMVDTFQ